MPGQRRRKDVHFNGCEVLLGCKCNLLLHGNPRRTSSNTTRLVELYTQTVINPKTLYSQKVANSKTKRNGKGNKNRSTKGCTLHMSLQEMRYSIRRTYTIAGKYGSQGHDEHRSSLQNVTRHNLIMVTWWYHELLSSQ